MAAEEAKEEIMVEDGQVDQEAVLDDSDVEIIQDIDDENEKPSKSKKKYVTSDELYKMILAHPTYRIVLHSNTGADWMHPLQYIYADDTLIFQEDASSTQLHPHGLCEDVLDLCGREGCPEMMVGNPVKLGGFYQEEWDKDYRCIVKCRKQDDAKWIRIYEE